MLSKVIFVFGFLMIGYSKSLRSGHFCNLAEKECAKTKLDCVYEKCPSSHVWQCGKSKCAINEKQCNEYLETERTLQSNMLNNYIHFSLIIPMMSSFNNKITQEFKQFQNSFKNCTRPAPPLPSPTLQANRKLNDIICVSGRNCYQFEKSKELCCLKIS